MNEQAQIVGIDLGTTNSEVAAYVDGKVEVLGEGNERILPSYVGLAPDDSLLVGEAARNQYLLYPERTVRSIKRRMGRDEKVAMGPREFSPPEISAMLLRTLADLARRRLDHPIERAIITVPAYFSDAQRQATRQAGALAGLDVVRIINEPTAASLAYGYGGDAQGTVMIYDLGGGTFDVSIVTMDDDVTEVLASHGDNQLGGDDFDQRLIDLLADEFAKKHGVDLRREHSAALARLTRAAEDAKKELSFAPHARVTEESLVVIDGRPRHLDREISRDEYEELIAPLLDRTFKSVSKALGDAGKNASELDAILLVGGSTRTPLVSQLFEQHVGMRPRQDVHPDLCVALGAGVLAARTTGHAVNRVLVDVSPFSFGPSFLGEHKGSPYVHCYKPIIYRNTPLPVTRTEAYYTAFPFQDAVHISIYQGEDSDALKNILVGEFFFEGLTPQEELQEVQCQMRLDVDGILEVTEIERSTGKSKRIVIDNALDPTTGTSLQEGREQIDDLFSRWTSDHGEVFSAGEGEEDGDASVRLNADASARDDLDEGGERANVIDISEHQPDEKEDTAWKETSAAAWELVERSRGLFEKMHEEDQEEALEIHETIDRAINAGDAKALSEATETLKELLFFIEGR